MSGKPELKVTVFSDYICPFCYIGDARLNRLRADYAVKVNWCFVEIHPQIAPEGEPVETLGYSAEIWRQMMSTLRGMADEENLSLREPDFITNSGAALLLAESAKFIDAKIFYRLHARLFEAYFTDGENIGDREILRRLGVASGLSDGQIEAAWQDSEAGKRLANYAQAARDLNIRATPTFFIGTERLDGVVPFASLETAARKALS